MMPFLLSTLKTLFAKVSASASTIEAGQYIEKKEHFFEPEKGRGLTWRRVRTSAIADALIFSLTYTPFLGAMTGFVAAAQTVQDSTYSYQYDVNGNLIKITDPLGRVTDLAVDALGRPTRHTLPAPQASAARPVVQYAYDGQDQLTAVTDPRNLVTHYTVDGLGNRGALASPDSGGTANAYDPAGNLTSSTDARGKRTSFTYDVLNRVIRIDYASGTPTVFEYDGGAGRISSAVGKLTGITDESGTTIYMYDGLARLISKTQTVVAGASSRSFSVGYAYGDSGITNGKLTSITYPSGHRVNYLYDDSGQLRRLTLDPSSGNATAPAPGVSTDLLTGIFYAPFGGVQSWYWGNSTDTAVNGYARTFDLDGRITSYTLGNVQTTGVLRHVAYDAGGRVLGYMHEGPSLAPAPAALDQTFTYDSLDRLTASQSASTSLGYSYDLNGNRTQLAIGSNSYASVVDSNSNRVLGTTGPAPAKTNLFDAAGSLLSDGTATYTYTDRGRLAQASKDGVTTAYAYNGIGQRVAKIGAAIATGANYFVYDEQGHLLGEYNATGIPVQETVYLGDTPVVVLANEVSYIYADHLNTPRLISRSSDGAVVWRWDQSDPFGVQPPLSITAGVNAFNYNLRFPGQVFDSETNNHYNYFRDYDPQTGRYVQSDPIGLDGGINTFGYVAGNPLAYSDSKGLQISGVIVGGVVTGLRWCVTEPACAVGAIAIIASQIKPGVRGDAATVSATAVEEFCSGCKATATRASARAAAYSWAGITPATSTPTPWSNFNPPGGSIFKRGPVWADFFRNNNAPNFGAFGDAGHVEEHPFGHPDIPGGLNHDCPHFVATNSKGITIEFAYRPGS